MWSSTKVRSVDLCVLRTASQVDRTYVFQVATVVEASSLQSLQEHTRRTKRECEVWTGDRRAFALLEKRCGEERTARVLGATGSELTPTRNPEAGGCGASCGASMAGFPGGSRKYFLCFTRRAVIGDGCDMSNIAVRNFVINQTASCPQFIAMPRSASSAMSTAPAKHPFAH